MFRNNSYHLNKPRFPEVQIREAWVSWGGKYCFSTPERKEAVYSKLAMRNAFCLLSLTLDNISYLSFRSFSRDCAGWVLPRADDSGPPTVFWMRQITLSHTPSPGCRLHTFSQVLAYPDLSRLACPVHKFQGIFQKACEPGYNTTLRGHIWLHHWGEDYAKLCYELKH